MLQKLLMFAPDELKEHMQTVNTPHRDLGGKYIYNTASSVNSSFPLDIVKCCDKYKALIDAALLKLEH